MKKFLFAAMMAALSLSAAKPVGLWCGNSWRLLLLWSSGKGSKLRGLQQLWRVGSVTGAHGL